MLRLVRGILVLAVVLTTALSAIAQKKGDKTVVFNAVLHCESCKAKVEKNLPYEKGVKDLKVDLKNQTITVTFKEDKNTTENLQKAIEKLNVEVKGLVNGDCPKAAVCEKAKAGKCPGAENCCEKSSGKEGKK